MGKLANEVRTRVEASINARREELAAELMEKRMAADACDVTLPGRRFLTWYTASYQSDS